jgi:DNA-directed RNA polymerase sigma subunit (sigma70/sigma32)
MRFGLDGEEPKTLAEVGEVMAVLNGNKKIIDVGLSNEGVRRLQETGLALLRRGWRS